VLTFKRGLMFGLVCMTMHYFANDKFFLKTYDRTQQQGHCRMPEIYVAMEALNRYNELRDLRDLHTK